MKNRCFIYGAVTLLLFFIVVRTNASEKYRNRYLDEAVGDLQENIITSNTNSFHFITHGRPGQLLIEGRWRNAAAIVAFIQHRQLLAPSVKQLNIYGCEFAKGAIGLAALQYLKERLGVAVAASTNITGTGGDYLLEIGNVNAANFFTGFKGSLQCAGTPGGTGSDDDFDKDGVCNSADLDDDNDGILDTMESRCGEAYLNAAGYTNGNTTITTTTANGIAVSTTFSTIRSNAGLSSSYPDGDSNGMLTFSFTSTQADTAVYYFITDLVFDKPVKVRLVYPGSAAGGTHSQTDIFGLLTPGTNSSFTITNPNDGSSDALDIIKNVPGEIEFRPAGNAEPTGVRTNYAVATSAPVTRVQVRAKSSYTANSNTSAIKVIIEVCDTLDTDNDNIPNHLDLDSDGDGCSDAYESTVPGATINTGSYTDSVVVNPASAASEVGTNGFKNSLETALNSGVPNFTDTYASYAMLDLIKACIDTDNDGIKDMIDIDDDNDGVLDKLENNCSDAASTGTWSVDNAVSPRVATYNFANGVIAKIRATGSFSTESFNNQNFWKEAFGGKASLGWNVEYNTTITINFENASGNPVYIDQPIINIDKIGGSDASNNQNSALLTLQNDLTWVKLAGTNDFEVTSTTVRDGGVGNPFTGSESGTANGATAAGSLQINQSVSSITITTSLSGAGGSNDGIEVILSNICVPLDTDNDNIPNHLDLDSDGDGCSDAYESTVPGATISTGSYTDSVVVDPASAASAVGANGFKNSLETALNSGVPNFTDTYSSYAVLALMKACIDTDNDSIGDVIDIDDDNDGIVDTVESRCGEAYLNAAGYTNGNTTITTTTANGIAVSTTFSTIRSNAGLSSSYPDGDSNGMLTFSFTSTQADTAVYYFITDLVFDKPVKVRLVYPGSAAGGEHSQTDIFGLLTPGTNSSFTITNPNDGSSDALDIIKNVPGEIEFRPAGSAEPTGVRTNYAVATSAPVTRVQVRAKSSYTANSNTSAIKVIIEVCDTLDTDNDNIPNYLDLDSDGDSCSDASETGISGTLLPGTLMNNEGPYYSPAAIAQGAYGANGFANALETGTESGVYNGSYTNYANAINNAVGSCVAMPFTRPDINAALLNLTVNGNLSTNDTIPAGSVYGNPLSVAGYSNPGTETPVIDEDGSYTFAASTPGIYKFKIPVCPPSVSVNCPQALLTIHVIATTAPDNLPVAAPDFATIFQNTSVLLKTLDNDRAVRQSETLMPSSVSVSVLPKQGTALVNSTTGDITYNPRQGFAGTDTLQYTVCDDASPDPNCVTGFQVITVLPVSANNSVIASDNFTTLLATQVINDNV